MRLYFISISLILWSFITISQTNRVRSTGHLLFHAASESPTTINPEIVKFYRQFDLKEIDKALLVLEAFRTKYSEFCKSIAITTETDEAFTIGRHNPYSADKECESRQGTLFEIKNAQDAQVLRKLMDRYGLRHTYAGLVIADDGQMTYNLDGQPNLYRAVRKCAECPTEPTFSAKHVKEVKEKYGQEIHVRYSLEANDTNEVVITLVNHNPSEPCKRYPVFCQKNQTPEGSILQQLVTHTCDRDINEIRRTNEMLYLELIQLQYPSNPRAKRAIALAAAGFLGLDGVISMFTGQSAFSHFGKGVAYTLGIATHADMAITKQELDRHAHQLYNISVNQMQLIEAHEAVVHDIERLDKSMEHIVYETAVLFADIDNKVNIYRLQNLVQHTLLKLVSAIQAGKQHLTSPYVFGSNDLHNISDYFRVNKVQMTNNIDDIITSVILVDNSYTFIIAVPLTDTNNHFFFYEVSVLPMFRDGQGYRVQTRNKYIAINAPNLQFFIASDTEYQVCTTYSMCSVAGPFEKLSASSPCEVRSLQLNANHCTFELDANARPTFLTYGNTTHYSVPTPMDIHVTCRQDRAINSFTERQQLTHYGQFHIPEGCKATIDPGITIRPGFVVSTHVLEKNTLFQILDTQPNLTFLPQTTTSRSTKLNRPSFRDVDNFKETIDVIFDHETAVPEALRIITYIFAVFLFLLFLCCISYKFRTCCKAFTMTQKPSKYWSEVRGYHVPHFTKKKKHDIEKGQNLAAEDNPKKPPHSHTTFSQKLEKLIASSRSARKPTPLPRFMNSPLLIRKTPIDETDIIARAPPSPPSNFRTLHYLADPARFNPVRPKVPPPPVPPKPTTVEQ